MPPKESIGLDIGTSGVRAAHVAFGQRPMSLENFGQVSLPTGAVRDGEIIDPGTVSKALEQLWKHGGFKGKKVTVGIANQKVVIRQVDLPYMPEEELRGAIQFQVQEYIPIPIEDAVLDFQILDDFMADSGERTMRVLLVAAQREMVNVFVNAVQTAGLDPEAVDVIPLAIVRALGDAGDALGGTPGMGEAIVDVGAGVTNIVVHSAGRPRFVRILLVGGNDLTEAMAVGLGVSYEDAERTKQSLSVPSAVPPEGPAVRILDDKTASLVDEIRGSLDYYQAQADAVRISRIVLTGGGSKLAGFPMRLANATRIQVAQGRVLERIGAGKGLRLSEQQLLDADPLMSGAVGLALGAAEL